ncbi:hypothetical protein D3C81_1924800 [compost metagenome]
MQRIGDRLAALVVGLEHDQHIELVENLLVNARLALVVAGIVASHDHVCGRHRQMRTGEDAFELHAAADVAGERRRVLAQLRDYGGDVHGMKKPRTRRGWLG